MSVHKVCPCCSNSMLHCLEGDRSYWFCRHCWQEMPDLTDRTKQHVTKEPTLTKSSLTPVASNNRIITSQH